MKGLVLYITVVIRNLSFVVVTKIYQVAVDSVGP